MIDDLIEDNYSWRTSKKLSRYSKLGSSTYERLKPRWQSNSSQTRQDHSRNSASYQSQFIAQSSIYNSSYTANDICNDMSTDLTDGGNDSNDTNDVLRDDILADVLCGEWDTIDTLYTDTSDVIGSNDMPEEYESSHHYSVSRIMMNDVASSITHTTYDSSYRIPFDGSYANGNREGARDESVPVHVSNSPSKYDRYLRDDLFSDESSLDKRTLRSLTSITSAWSSQRSGSASGFSDYSSIHTPISDRSADWRELFDENTGRPYYINTSTQQRQWRRPSQFKSSRPGSDRGSYNEKKSRKSHSVTSDKFRTPSVSPKLDYEKEGTFFRPICPAKPTFTNSVKEVKIVKVREYIDELRVRPPATGKVTVHRIEYLGSKDMTGYLWKRSKYLSRWVQRYFILTGNSLQCYSHENSRRGKEYIIKDKVQIHYNMKDISISIEGLRMNDIVVPPLVLQAETDKILETWIEALYCHIHTSYKIMNNIECDFLDHGDVCVSFWKFVHYVDKTQGFAIRTLPFLDAPLTNEYVYSGETVEIIQTLVAENSTKFFRLADDRGWVFNAIANDKQFMFQEVKGHYVEELRTYIQNTEKHVRDTLTIFCGPSMESDQAQRVSIAPGATFTVSAAWRPSIYDEKDESILFVKLYNEKAWVAIKSSSSVTLVHVD